MSSIGDFSRDIGHDHWTPVPHRRRSSGGEMASDTNPATVTSAGQPVDQPAVATARNISSATMPSDWLAGDRRTRLDPRLARWLLLFVSISSTSSTPFIRRLVLSSVFPPDFRSPVHKKRTNRYCITDKILLLTLTIEFS